MKTGTLSAGGTTKSVLPGVIGIMPLPYHLTTHNYKYKAASGAKNYCYALPADKSPVVRGTPASH